MENENYKIAIALHCNDFCHKLIVGHVQINLSDLSKVLFKFLQLHSLTHTFDVTVERVSRSAGYNLEIPFTYTSSHLQLFLYHWNVKNK